VDCIGSSEKQPIIIFYALSKHSKTVTSPEIAEKYDIPLPQARRLLRRIYESQRQLEGLTVTRYYEKFEITEYTFEHRP